MCLMIGCASNKKKNMKENTPKLQQLEQIVDRHQDRLFRFAFFRTGSQADAEDIVQDVLLHLFRSESVLDHVNDVENYLMRAIANRCNNHHRRKPQSMPVVDKVPDLPDTDDRESRQVEYERVARLLDELPARQAEVIRMKTHDSLTFARIAELTGIPEPTVKSRFRYGIQKLRQLIIKNQAL